jgi:hypothetical protein
MAGLRVWSQNCQVKNISADPIRVSAGKFIFCRFMAALVRLMASARVLCN